jgi:hypothetical protein
VITRFPAEDLVIAGRPYYTVGGALPLERETQSNLNTHLDANAREARPPDVRSPGGDGVPTPRRVPVADRGAEGLR